MTAKKKSRKERHLKMIQFLNVTIGIREFYTENKNKESSHCVISGRAFLGGSNLVRTVMTGRANALQPLPGLTYPLCTISLLQNYAASVPDRRPNKSPWFQAIFFI
jgi:hypothetical protein